MLGREQYPIAVKNWVNTLAEEILCFSRLSMVATPICRTESVKTHTASRRKQSEHTSEASTSWTCFDISGPFTGPFCGGAGAVPGVEPTAGAGPVGLSPGALGAAAPAEGTFVTPFPLFCESSSAVEFWLAFMTFSGMLLFRSRS
jgi:hypothetical protein